MNGRYVLWKLLASILRLSYKQSESAMQSAMSTVNGARSSHAQHIRRGSRHLDSGSVIENSNRINPAATGLYAADRKCFVHWTSLSDPPITLYRRHTGQCYQLVMSRRISREYTKLLLLLAFSRWNEKNFSRWAKYCIKVYSRRTITLALYTSTALHWLEICETNLRRSSLLFHTTTSCWYGWYASAFSLSGGNIYSRNLRLALKPYYSFRR